MFHKQQKTYLKQIGAVMAQTEAKMAEDTLQYFPIDFCKTMYSKDPSLCFAGMKTIFGQISLCANYLNIITKTMKITPVLNYS